MMRIKRKELFETLRIAIRRQVAQVHAAILGSDILKVVLNAR